MHFILNTCEFSTYLRQLYTPQHVRDEATGDVDGNNLSRSIFNDLESYLFIKKAQQSETLQPGPRKTLRLSIRSAPAQ